MKLEKMVRNVYKNLTPYTCSLPDLPIEEIKHVLGKDRVYKLSFNENPLGPSEKAITAMEQTLKGLNLYPSSGGDALKDDIASLEGVLPEQIVLSNGADDMIALLAQIFLETQDEVLIPEITFPQYAASVNIMGAKVVHVPMKGDLSIDLDGIIESITSKTKIIFLCNPNNPTGKILTKQELDAFIKKVPEHVLVVIDEAYYEYVEAEEFCSAVEHVNREKMVFVIRTFSKIYALAAARIGYGIANASLIEAINRVRPPFNVNGIAQAGALASLLDLEFKTKSKNLNSKVKHMMYQALEELGVSYISSETNFILIDTEVHNEEIFELFADWGLIVRTIGHPKLSTYLRVSIGSEEEMLYFIDAFKSIKNNLVKEKVV